MESLAYIAVWVLASVVVGVVAGFLLGRNTAKHRDANAAERDRQATLNVLVELLRSIERLTDDMQCHRSEIQETARHVGGMQVTGEMEQVKKVLLGHVASLLESNRRSQTDLAIARYQMEEQAEQIDHARHEARMDALTGTFNRRAFDEKLALLLATYERQGQPFVMILADLDHFKRINDAHGHAAGDSVLEEVGSWLKEAAPEGSFVARYGGDEFVVLLPRTTLAEGAEVAEALRAQTAERTSRVDRRNDDVSVSVSLGVAAVREGDTAESLFQRADRCLYESKRLGRNQVRCEGAGATDETGDEAEAATTPVAETHVGTVSRRLQTARVASEGLE